MSTPFLFPLFSIPDAPEGFVYTYSAGTLSPKVTWSDAAGTIPNTNPVQLDTVGRATIRFDSGSYDIVVKDQTNTVNVWSMDSYDSPLQLSDITATLLGGFLNPITQAEITAGVTPTNLIYETLNPLRYGAVGNGATDDHAAVQLAFNVAGFAGGTVIFPPGYTFLCSADINVPVAATVGGTIPCAQGPGWGTVSVVFGAGSTFGFVILGTGATTGDTQGSTYNYAGTFRDIGIQLGAGNSAFYINSVNQPRIENCWIRGAGTTSNRAVLFLNCLLPVFEDSLVTGCGSATQYSVEFDTCTTASWRGSRISGGNTTKGGLAIDRCTNFVGEGVAVESCGPPVVIGGKAEASIACTGVILRGLELENPGLNQYVVIGSGLTGSALVIDVLLDGMFGSPSGTTTVAYGVKLLSVSGFEARGCHFTLGSAPTACFEIANTNVSGVVIRPHRNLQSLGVPWVRYNGAQVLAAGPQMEWQLGGLQSTGGRPTCTSRGFSGLYSATALTGTAPSILVSSSMGGFYSNIGMTNGSPTTVTTLSGGEPGMEITIIPTDGNTTLTNGNSGGAFRLIGGANLNIAAGKAYKFVNDGANGASGGSCWVQL